MCIRDRSKRALGLAGVVHVGCRDEVFHQSRTLEYQPGVDLYQRCSRVSHIGETCGIAYPTDRDDRDLIADSSADLSNGVQRSGEQRRTTEAAFFVIRFRQLRGSGQRGAVSYTHLTLPTILRV